MIGLILLTLAGASGEQALAAAPAAIVVERPEKALDAMPESWVRAHGFFSGLAATAGGKRPAMGFVY